MPSSNFIAIRVGKKIPESHRKTGQRVNCGECGGIFWVVGPRVLVDKGATDEQIEKLEIAIAGEHFEEKFSDHLES
jgi:hypothetical protein